MKKNAAKPGKLEAARPEKVVGLLEYQKGSVVSRTFAQNNRGTLTMFAFDKGEGLSEHSAPFDAYVLVLDGEIRITIKSKPVRAAKGQIVLMPGRVPHALKALTKAKMLLVMIKA